MGGDPQRVIDHLHTQINALKRQVAWSEDQIGPANLRYSALKDQYDAHMASQHWEPAHLPCVAPLANGGWGVYCEACSLETEEYVYPCRQPTPGDEWPPMLLVPVPPTTDAVAPVADAADQEQGEADDDRRDPQLEQDRDGEQVGEQDQNHSEDDHGLSVPPAASQAHP